MYLSKVKWDDIVERRALDKAQRGRKLGLEVERGRKEAEQFLERVDKSRVVDQMRARKGNREPEGGGFKFTQRGITRDEGRANKSLAQTLFSGGIDSGDK